MAAAAAPGRRRHNDLRPTPWLGAADKREDEDGHRVFQRIMVVQPGRMALLRRPERT